LILRGFEDFTPEIRARFVRNANEETARAKNEDGLEIILRTVQELIDETIEASHSEIRQTTSI
jgi:hypothetical protein